MLRVFPSLVCFFVIAMAYADEAVLYESRAKILVRYAVEKNSADGVESTTGLNADPTRSEAVMSAESEIISGHDLALEVTEAVGLDRLATGAGLPKTEHKDAVQAFRERSRVTVPKGSTILSLSFRSCGSGLPKLVLEEVMRCYFEKHLTMHRSQDVSDIPAKGVVSLQTLVKEADERLRILKAEPDARLNAQEVAALATQIVNVGEARRKLKAELAEREKKGDQAQMDEALDSTKMLSIRVAENPSKPVPLSR